MNLLIKAYITWLIPGIFVALLYAFAAYVRSEKQIDQVNDNRYQSYQLAEELSQSSDALTLMARSYVITGDVRYKNYYQSILAIRNGSQPRTPEYQNFYLYGSDDKASLSATKSTATIPLLALIQQQRPTEEEFHKLEQAKANSDALTAIEKKAMDLMEDNSQDQQQRREQAIALLHDNQYLKAKADIIKPIGDYIKSLDLRTSRQVRLAQRNADNVRLVLLVMAIIFIITLYRVKTEMQSSLKAVGQANEKYKSANQELLRQAQITNRTLQKLKLATEISGMGIWIWELEQNTVRWDDAMFDIYGVAAAKRNTVVPYDFWSTRVHPEDLPQTEALLNSSRHDNKYLRNRFRIIVPDGGIRFIDSGSVIELDANGRPLNIAGINRDITDEVRQQEKISAALLKANAANKAKTAFLANISHELRTPMTGVLGMLDLLADTALSPKQTNWLNTAQESGQTLLEIINDIIDLTRLDADKFEIVQEDFNLVDLTEDICTQWANRAHAKGLELNCLLPVGPSQCWQGDPRRIRQVLSNLIGNALKFTEQGEIFVSVTQTLGENGQAEVRFEVHDTGIGISKLTIDTLFQPFAQAEEGTSRRFGGTGLGLAISKKLVRLMGGKIGVDSTLDIGSCFWFTLPMTQCESAQALPTANEMSAELSGKRALIVDDNITSRNILDSYLTSWGLLADNMDNVGEVPDHLQSAALNGAAYDIILLARQTSVMRSVALARCLAQIPAIAGIPVILLTTENRIEPAQYQGTSITRHLLKPVRQLQLYNAMKSALLGGGAEASPKQAQPEQLPSYQGKKVLVVEDNKINQKVMVAKLNKFEIFPDVVENGQLALEKLAQSSYDLIFMDCHMPVKDGYTATRELRLLEQQQGLPRHAVIAFTANAMNGEFDKCLEAGMDDYISKPIHSEQLMAILAYWLNYSPLASNGNTITPIADHR